MLVEAAAQAQAKWHQAHASRKRAVATQQVAHGHQQSADWQLAVKWALAAANAAKRANLVWHEKRRPASAGRNIPADRTQSILTAGGPGAGFAPVTARPTADLAILPTIMTRLNQVGTAPIHAADAVIDRAEETQTPARRSEHLRRPVRTFGAQLSRHARALRSLQGAEAKIITAKAQDPEAVQKSRIALLLREPLMAGLAGTAPAASSLLAAVASRQQTAGIAEWLKPTDRESSAEDPGNRDITVAHSQSARDPKPAELSQSFGINLRSSAGRRLEPIIRNTAGARRRVQKKRPEL